MKAAQHAALALFLGGCLISPERARSCFENTCEECIELSGCGWCPGEGCISGTSVGPASGTCGRGWNFASCEETPDPCETHRSCDLCLMASGCSWCAGSSGGCTLFRDTCELGPIAVCPPPPACSDHRSCSTCVGDVSCAWRSAGNSFCADCTFAGSGVCEDRFECTQGVQCEGHESCGTCINDPECEWVDDVSGNTYCVSCGPGTGVCRAQFEC